MSAPRFSAARKLEASDGVDAFDCGVPELNTFLQRFAWVGQKAHGAQTYVTCLEGDAGSVVAGYYSLVVGCVARRDAPKRVTTGLARHPVPVMILARLAVDRGHQGRGLGRALLKDAVLRTLQAADIAGIRAMLVHAKGEAARQWYLSWGFEPSPTDPYHLFLLIKDMRAAVS